MANTNDLRRGRGCVFLLHAHLVFVTKYRKTVFTKEHFASMKKIFERICSDFDVELSEFDGEGDHVHLLVNYPPKVAISKLVNSMKGVSSRMLKQYHPDIRRFYWRNALWSPSYFAGSCGGAPLSTIRKYIEDQESPR